MGGWGWRWGGWRGRVDMGGFRDVPAILAGGLLRPDPGCLAAVEALRLRGDAMLREANEALAARLACWRLDGMALTAVGEQDAVRPGHVLVCRGGREVEVGFPVDWDEEHLWGARFRDWALTELNESVPRRA